MEDFKISVTPEQSRIVQLVLLDKGIKWIVSEGVSHTDKPYLYCDDSTIYSGSCGNFFKKDPSIKYTFDQFMQKYGNKRVSKTKQLT